MFSFIVLTVSTSVDKWTLDLVGLGSRSDKLKDLHFCSKFRKEPRSKHVDKTPPSTLHSPSSTSYSVRQKRTVYRRPPIHTRTNHCDL